MFKFQHIVHVYETDLMGVVHHSNYLRFFEEARVAWAHSVGIIDYQKPESAAHFAVIETRVKHLRPALFGDRLDIQMQLQGEGLRLQFQYRLKRGDEILALAETHHVPLDKNLKLTRWTNDFKKIISGLKWSETWMQD